MTKTLIAALAAVAIAAALASEQAHPGFITPTHAGGFVGMQSGEAGGAFDKARATPLDSGGQMVDQQGSAGGRSFDATLATKVGHGSTTSGLRS